MQYKTLTGLTASLLLISGSIFGECRLPANFDSKSMKEQIRYIETRPEPECQEAANELRGLLDLTNSVIASSRTNHARRQSEQSTRELAVLIQEIRALEKEIDEIELWIRYEGIANDIRVSKSCGPEYRIGGQHYRDAKRIYDEIEESGGKWTQAAKDEAEHHVQLHKNSTSRYRQCFETRLLQIADVTSRGIDSFAEFKLAYDDLRTRYVVDTDENLSSKKVKLKELNERRVFLLEPLVPTTLIVKDDKPDEKTVKPKPDIPWGSLDDDEVEQPELPCVGVLGMTGEECG